MPDRRQNVAILGATGSIGCSTLDVVARHPDRYRAFALTAHRNIERLAEQCVRFQPRYAVVRDGRAADELLPRIAGTAPQTEVLAGSDALADIAGHAEVDIVMAAIVGAAGLPPTLRAAQAGKKLLLANKEALVMSGALFMRAVTEHGATLLPIDSEHNAVFQCLPNSRHGRASGMDAAGVDSILLTASGGPFRTRPLATLADVTPAEAVAHPNWSMGRKISVDSATMMNKGLEVIEAHWLFGVPADRIEIVVHPQSVVHSMVRYCDGSVLAQLGHPDMRTPIAYGLAYPERIDGGVAPLDLTRVGRLEFEPLSMERFPCARLAYQALERGGTAPAVLNAANEVAVEAFLNGGLGFLEIAAVVERTLADCRIADADSLDAVLAADTEARRQAACHIGHRTSAPLLVSVE